MLSGFFALRDCKRARTAIIATMIEIATRTAPTPKLKRGLEETTKRRRDIPKPTISTTRSKIQRPGKIVLKSEIVGCI
jgi:hypothetical protein